MALKGMEPAPNPQRQGGSKRLEGAHLSLLHQRQKMKENDSTAQGKTKHMLSNGEELPYKMAAWSCAQFTDIMHPV